MTHAAARVKSTPVRWVRVLNSSSFVRLRICMSNKQDKINEAKAEEPDNVTAEGFFRSNRNGDTKVELLTLVKAQLPLFLQG